MTHTRIKYPVLALPLPWPGTHVTLTLAFATVKIIMAQQIYEQWFRVADEDKDGAVGGAETVRFFMRSGLQQAVLGHVGNILYP